MNEREIFWRLLLGLALFYTAWSPFSVAGQGYTQENIAAAERLVVGWTAPEKEVGRISRWPRHGPVEPLLFSPFVAAGHLLPGDPSVNADRLLCLLPIVATALLGGLVFLWGVRLGASALASLGAALGVTVGTELWPYSYIGLETTQSLALFLAGFLALADRRRRSWLHLLAFASAASIAITAKATGAVLLPAVVFLVWRYLASPHLTVARLRAATVVTTVMGGGFVLAALGRAEFWSARVAGGQWQKLRGLLVESPVDLGLNLLGLLAGSNKGLAVFAPPALLGLFLWSHLHRRDRDAGRFVALVVSGLGLGFSALTFWSDETWGPRYLHSAIAPLGLALAAAVGSHGKRWARGLLATTLVGVTVSSLGVLFYWGSLHQAAMRTRAATLESLQYDPAWNAVRFHGGLFRCWAFGSCDTWPPPHRWYDFSAPPPGEPPVLIALAEYARPQPLLLARWTRGTRPPWVPTLPLLLCLVGGVGAIFAAARAAGLRHPGGGETPVRDR